MSKPMQSSTPTLAMHQPVSINNHSASTTTNNDHLVVSSNRNDDETRASSLLGRHDAGYIENLLYNSDETLSDNDYDLSDQDLDAEDYLEYADENARGNANVADDNESDDDDYLDDDDDDLDEQDRRILNYTENTTNNNNSVSMSTNNREVLIKKETRPSKSLMNNSDRNVNCYTNINKILLKPPAQPNSVSIIKRSNSGGNTCSVESKNFYSTANYNRQIKRTTNNTNNEIIIEEIEEINEEFNVVNGENEDQKLTIDMAARDNQGDEVEIEVGVDNDGVNEDLKGATSTNDKNIPILSRSYSNSKRIVNNKIRINKNSRKRLVE